MKAALFVAALGLSAFGCAHYQMACPIAGGPEWLELKSPHFTLRTDLPADQAERLLRDDETLLDTLQAAASALLPPSADKGRLSLVIFAESWQYDKLVKPEQSELASGFRRIQVSSLFDADERGRPMVVLTHDPGNDATLSYELARQIVNQRLHEPPPWLSGGLAEYLTATSRQAGTLALGGPTARLLEYNRQRQLGVNPVVSAYPLQSVQSFLQGLYPQHGFIDFTFVAAWGLVHYLANGGPDHPARFRTFLSAIADGAPVAETLIGQYGSLDAIDAAYHQQLAATQANQPKPQLVAYAPPPTPPRITVRTLDDAELHQLKVIWQPATRDRELALAKAHAPQSPALHRWLALLADAEGHDAAAEQEIAAAVRLAGADHFYACEQARLHLEHALKKPESERHLDRLGDELRAVAHWVDEPAQLDFVARYYHLVGDDAFAAAFAARAVALDPQCAHCLVTQAQIFLARGDQPNAIAALQAALRRSKDPADGYGGAALLLARLKQCETSGGDCAK